MKIDKGSWHAQWYAWWKKHYYGSWRQDNLCLYCRAVVFYAPARWLFTTNWKRTLASWLMLVAMAHVVAYKVVGGFKIIKGFWIGVGVMAAAVAAALLVIFVAIGLKKLWDLTTDARPVTTFTSVLAARVHAAHRGICPLIEFTEEIKK